MPRVRARTTAAARVRPAENVAGAILLVGAGLLLKSFQRLRSADMGCITQDVLTMHLGLPDARYPTPAQRANFFDTLLARVRGLPGVHEAAFVTVAPGQGYSGDWGFTVVEHPLLLQGRGLSAIKLWADPKYFATMGIPLLAGRTFTAQDTQNSPKVAVINESMARRFFPNGSAVGRRFAVGETPDHPGEIEVIGVVKDAKYNALDEGSLQAAYFPCTQNVGFYGSFAVRYASGANRREIIARVRNSIAEINPNILVDGVTGLDDQVNQSIATQSLIARLTSFFGFIAVFLACIGIYGLLSYSVARRTSELGIRLALGAQSRMLLWQVLRESLLLLIIGLAIGIPIALSSTRILKSLLYELSPLDPAAITTAVAAVVVMTLAAAWLPARSATKINPIQALRAE